MSKIIKYTIVSFLFLILLGIAWYSGMKYNLEQSKSTVKQDIILQQIKSVLQVGTIEGSFSEIYDYKEYYAFDISPFQKKALLRVKADVLVGFNLDSISITVSGKNKTVVISELPKPEILSIDHDLDYYDISEGTFNSFTKEDYNKMNSQAKIAIKNTVMKSEMLNKAQLELEKHLELLNSLLKSYGWKLKYNFGSKIEFQS